MALKERTHPVGAAMVGRAADGRLGHEPATPAEREQLIDERQHVGVGAIVV